MVASTGLLNDYAAGVELLKTFEGCKLKAYKCAAGVWTIGWGSTSHLDGKAVKAGDEISKSVADQMLNRTLEFQVLPALRELPYWDKMTPEQRGALISFAWNLGWNFYEAKGFETISRRLRERDWDKVPETLLLYRNPGSTFEAGLRRRRKAEGELWIQGEHGTGQAGQSQSESHASKPEVMRIEARRATVLKKEMKQAAELGDKGVLSVAAGKVYGVAEYTEVAANAHARVELAGGAGTWYIWGPHWRMVGEPAKAGAGSAVDWRDFNALVTPNVSVGEILQWDKRRIPPEGASVRARLVRTAQEFQRIRDAWGRPLGITSFYRPADINAAVGGVPNSKHILGTAIDVYPVNASIDAFYQWIRQRWSGGLGDGRHKGFIHLDLAAKTETDGHFGPGAGVRPYREWTY